MSMMLKNLSALPPIAPLQMGGGKAITFGAGGAKQAWDILLWASNYTEPDVDRFNSNCQITIGYIVLLKDTVVGFYG